MAKKGFYDWFLGIKTKTEIDKLKAISERDGKPFTEPDVIAFDHFVDGQISGTATKKMAMIKGKYFKELFDEIKNNPDTSYVTCCDEYIKSSTKAEFENFPVSVIGKCARHDNIYYTRAELIYSRLANLFGIKTAFVLPLTEDFKGIASVDILKVRPQKKGERKPAEERSELMESFEDLTGVELDILNTIDTWMGILKKTIDKNNHKWQLSQEQIDKIMLDFIRVYIVRRYVFKDNDFQSTNVNFIHSGDYTDLEIAPSFDYEFCGDMPRYITINMPEATNRYIQESCLEFLIDNYPQQIEQVMKEIKSTISTKSNQINDIFDRFSPQNTGARVNDYNLIQVANDLLTTYSKVKEQNMEKEN